MTTGQGWPWHKDDLSARMTTVRELFSSGRSSNTILSESNTILSEEKCYGGKLPREIAMTVSEWPSSVAWPCLNPSSLPPFPDLENQDTELLRPSLSNSGGQVWSVSFLSLWQMRKTRLMKKSWWRFKVLGHGRLVSLLKSQSLLWGRTVWQEWGSRIKWLISCCPGKKGGRKEKETRDAERDQKHYWLGTKPYTYKPLWRILHAWSGTLN